MAKIRQIGGQHAANTTFDISNKITCEGVSVISVNIKPNYLLFAFNGMMAPSVKEHQVRLKN